MALDEYGIGFLAASRRAGVSFEHTATMGRQAVLARRRALIAAYTLAGCVPEDSLPPVITGWADPILRQLGAVDIVSIDASPYEGASVVHDLNEQFPDALLDRFSAVIDAGTVEHIFNFPIAIANYMRSVSVGGHLILITPTNNEAGHGFYQFSPELFYRVLSVAHGFEVEEMLLLEPGVFRPRWYEVRDPMVIGSRGQFRSRRVTYLFIRARRVGPIPRLGHDIQQSDYVLQWKQPTPGGKRSRIQVLGGIAASKFPVLKELYHASKARQFSLYHRPPYARLSSHFRRVPGPGHMSDLSGAEVSPRQ